MPCKRTGLDEVATDLRPDLADVEVCVVVEVVRSGVLGGACVHHAEPVAEPINHGVVAVV